MELYNAPEEYSRIVHYDTVKEQQVRLTVNTFRGIEYMHLRKYYLDFEEEFKKKLSFEKNRQLNQFSTIYFNKIRQNAKIKNKN